MATTKKLQLKFGTTFGTKTWTFANVNGNADATTIKTLMQAMITNGSIYKYPPLTMDSANIIQTTTTEVDLT